MEVQSMTTKYSTFVELPPSCIEICPWKPSFVVVGTYKLEDSDQVNARAPSAQRRYGSLLLFESVGWEL